LNYACMLYIYVFEHPRQEADFATRWSSHASLRENAIGPAKRSSSERKLMMQDVKAARQYPSRVSI